MWLAKLKRMLDELPERYLQPQPGNPELMEMIPPGLKPIGQLTDEEKRLDGLFRQLYDTSMLEFKAHKTLYGEDENKHPIEACHQFNSQMVARDEELRLILGTLRRSFRERLGFENEYVVDNNDIYVLPPIPVPVVFYNPVFHEPGNDGPTIFDDDPKKMN